MSPTGENGFIVHPFFRIQGGRPVMHLFGRLSQPAVAVEVLKMVEEDLRTRELAVTRTPFGWFNTLDIRAKGHPMSRVARKVSAE